MKTIQMEVPDQLYQDIQNFVHNGWSLNEGELLREAVRRYLDSHRPDLIEHFIQTDVQWGLRGKN